jgi:SH3-like domain-containing protein
MLGGAAVLVVTGGPAGAQTAPPPPHHPPHKVPVVQAPHAMRAQKLPPPAASVPASAEAAPAPAPAAPAPAAPAPPAADKGTVTGLKLPRFVALKSDDVNLRRGPGTRYPIEWVYQRRDLPVEVQREFDVWRLIATPDGTQGWVHEATLKAQRGFIVTGEDRTLRATADDAAAAVAVLKPGVVGRIRSCAAGADWCQVSVQDYRGWLKRSEFWGCYPGEVIP